MPYADSHRRRRAVVVGAGAVLIFAFTCAYRFNTLGGALGGFDDDHFLHLAYAKQVQAGEQPLRDFAGMGLQGARPALASELSAAAQNWLGNNLRSEALLCVVALALAAVGTFVAAGHVAPWWLAFAATVLSVVLAPKLYSYPKVITLAAAALAVMVYVRRTSVPSAAALAIVSAAAFLFRHDLAAYVGAAASVAVVAANARWRPAAAHLALYGVLTLALLVPSLFLIARDAGIREYVRESVGQTTHETNRTQIPWPAFTWGAAGSRPDALRILDDEQNAIAWLYYVHLALPVFLLAAVWRAGSALEPHTRAAIAAISAGSLLVVPAFLRGNMGARFGDMGPWFAVLLAAGAAWALRQGSARSLAAWGARAALTLVCLAATVQSVWSVGSVTRELDASGLSDSASKVVRQTRRYWVELASLPDAYWVGEPASPSIAVAQYLHRCTPSDSRIIVIGYEPELLPLADRRFGAGRAVIVPGFGTGVQEQRQMVVWWDVDRVPLVLADTDPEWPRELPLVTAVLNARYTEQGVVTIDGGAELKVFARHSAGPVGTFRDLPCFR